MHTFPEQTPEHQIVSLFSVSLVLFASEHRIKSDSKFLFYFVEILHLKVFYRRDFSYLFSSFHKSETCQQPEKSHFTMFIGIKCYVNQWELYTNLQNIDRNKTVSFGVSAAEVEKETHSL